MKYIVWGAGQRGKKAVEILGKDKILCVVDKDKKKVGGVIQNIPIEEISCIKECQERFIILITPVEFDRQIAQELEQMGRYNYLFFADYPYAIDIGEEADSMGWMNSWKKRKGRTVICGITWFTLYLYDALKKTGTDVAIYLAGQNGDTITNIIQDEYNIIKNQSELKQDDFLIAEDNYGFGEGKYFDINDFIEKSYPIYNSKVEKYKSIHKGKRCFIIATGPSLKIDDLDKMHQNGDICISMNRIYNLFDRTNWRPDYYMIEDEKMIEDLAEEIAELKLEHKFVNGKVQKYWGMRGADSSIGFRMMGQQCLSDRIGFSKKLERMVYNGYTVTYACLQLALYMGFSEIYLVGVDFNYSSDVYDKSNHFEGYQKYYKDIRLNPIMPEKMLRAYQKAKKTAESVGVKILNATRGGKLEVFERADLDKLLEKRGEKKMKILVWGCGTRQRFILEHFHIDYAQLDFTDSNTELWGKEYRNKPILPLNQVQAENYDFCMIGSAVFADSIKGDAIKFGFEERQIVPFDYLNSLWERWKKFDLYKTWRYIFENEKIQIIENWHMNDKDAVCIIKLCNACFYDIYLKVFDLYEASRQIEVYNISSDSLVEKTATKKIISFFNCSKETVLKIKIKEAVTGIPWCGLFYKKSEYLKKLEKCKVGKQFIDVYDSNSRFPYYDEDYTVIAGIANMGGVILDVGANYGQSMYAFYHLTNCKIISLEVVPDLYEVLLMMKNLIDTDDRITIINAGVSDREEELTWYEPINPLMAGSFDRSFINGRKLGVDIIEKQMTCYTLDNLIGIDKNICFIKLDVEGFEYEAICGAKGIIASSHPVILIEQNDKLKEIEKLLKEEYDVFYYDLCADKFVEERHSRLNCWLIPKETYRTEMVNGLLRGRM